MLVLAYKNHYKELLPQIKDSCERYRKNTSIIAANHLLPANQQVAQAQLGPAAQAAFLATLQQIIVATQAIFVEHQQEVDAIWRTEFVLDNYLESGLTSQQVTLAQTANTNFRDDLYVIANDAALNDRLISDIRRLQQQVRLTVISLVGVPAYLLIKTLMAIAGR